MTKAFKCERCGDFHEGSPKEMRFDNLKRMLGLGSEYNFEFKREVCRSCYETIKKAVEEEINLGE